MSILQFNRFFTITIIGIIFSATSYATDTIQSTVSADSCYSIIQSNILNENFYIIDVRTSGEFSSGHLHNAINIDVRSTEFSMIIDTLDRNGTYVMHCQSGSRSAGAFSSMVSMGFIHLYEMQSGYSAWVSAGYPTTISEINLSFAYISAEDANSLIDDNSIVFIDTRNTADYTNNHIPNAINIPYNSDDFIDQINALDKEESYVFYCESSTLCRSESQDEIIINILYNNQFSNIQVIDGGFDAWLVYIDTTSEDQQTTGIIVTKSFITINGQSFKINVSDSNPQFTLTNTVGEMVYSSYETNFFLESGYYVLSVIVGENVTSELIHVK